MCQRALCTYNGGCDCDVLEVIDSRSNTDFYNYNFTKQAELLNEQPFYFSVKQLDPLLNHSTQGFLPLILVSQKQDV